ncbi:phage tail tube protein [Methylobacterium sp. E-041]|uniref:phage tail tube protein n=1 Tax=Methylobacterium sp. E-041 TaxID=2836573 RepID=UPI001FBADCC4|nr:phage tail tube protein [Methylobacterium sp. E-041]MCJ2108029.1 phage tail tube protein [Methylobacterium sp. E-041]
MQTTGGRFTLDINGRRYSGRGKGTIMPATATRENGANQDGTGWSSVKPQLASLDLTFDRGVGLKWDADMMLAELNVTFVETDAGKRTHLFTNANWSGQPSLDTENGEVSGLKIETATYQVN